MQLGEFWEWKTPHWKRVKPCCNGMDTFCGVYKVNQTMTEVRGRGGWAKETLRMRWMDNINFRYDMNTSVVGRRETPKTGEDGGGWYSTPTWHPSWTGEKGNKKTECELSDRRWWIQAIGLVCFILVRDIFNIVIGYLYCSLLYDHWSDNVENGSYCVENT